MRSITNKKAKFEYTFLDTFIAGICLLGSEIKPIREAKVSFVDSYCAFIGNDLYIKNLIISGGKEAFQHDPLRDKKLLLTKKELKKLKIALNDNGITIVPFKIFNNERSRLKVEIALAKGKKKYDKREEIKKKDIKKEINVYL
jgi:SsrA-binding protein